MNKDFDEGIGHQLFPSGFSCRISSGDRLNDGEGHGLQVIHLFGFGVDGFPVGLQQFQRRKAGDGLIWRQAQAGFLLRTADEVKLERWSAFLAQEGFVNEHIQFTRVFDDQADDGIRDLVLGGSAARTFSISPSFL